MTLTQIFPTYSSNKSVVNDLWNLSSLPYIFPFLYIFVPYENPRSPTSPIWSNEYETKLFHKVKI